jgi:hypothetical protein
MLLPVLMLLFVAWLVLMPVYAVGFGWSDVPDWLQVLGALGLCSRSTVCTYSIGITRTSTR